MRIRAYLPLQIRMSTTKNSALAIGFYPTFKYNASGGGGVGSITSIEGNKATVHFDPKDVLIPPLNWRTGVHLQLPFKMRIKSWVLQQSLKLDIAIGDWPFHTPQSCQGLIGRVTVAEDIQSFCLCILKTIPSQRCGFMHRFRPSSTFRSFQAS